MRQVQFKRRFFAAVHMNRVFKDTLANACAQLDTESAVIGVSGAGSLSVNGVAITDASSEGAGCAVVWKRDLLRLLDLKGNALGISCFCGHWAVHAVQLGRKQDKSIRLLLLPFFPDTTPPLPKRWKPLLPYFT